MLRTLQTARHALHLEQTRLDNLANNLANAATSGFRQVLTRVTEQGAAGLPDRAGEGEAPPEALPVAGPTSRAWPDARPLVMSQAVDMRPGPIEETGRNLDLALSGPGFFVVRDLEGNEFYTRDGGFHVDALGQLATASGLAVQGTGGPLQVGGGAVAIDRDGNLSVDGNERGRLRVVTFERPERLLHRGDGMLAAPAELAAQDVGAGQVTVAQGYREGSNVDAVRTLVDMIAAQRAFEIGTKVLQANDEMLGQSVNTLGRNQ